MARPNPYTFPAEWARVELNNWAVPALLVAFDDCELEDEWNVQRAIGTSGASTVWRGTKPVDPISMTFEAPNKDLFDTLYTLFDRLKPTRGARPPTVRIKNPIPNFLGVDRVSRKKISAPFVTSSLSWRMKVAFIEYRPLILVPIGPQEPAKLPAEPTPADAAERAILDLTKQASALL